MTFGFNFFEMVLKGDIASQPNLQMNWPTFAVNLGTAYKCVLYNSVTTPILHLVYQLM